MLTNDDLEKIKKEAEDIQNDSSMTLKEREAAFDLVLAVGRLDIARLERHLRETGHGAEVDAMLAKAKGY